MFSDIHPRDWFFISVAPATNVSLINGYEDGTFQPDHYISREEMMTVTARALVKYANYKMPAEEEAAAMLKEKFIDGDTVQEYAAASVALNVQNNIVKGYLIDGNFEMRPANPITRAEVCAIFAGLG